MIEGWGVKNLVAAHFVAAAAVLVVGLVEWVPDLIAPPLPGVRQAAAGMPLLPVVPTREALRALPLSAVAAAPAQDRFSLDEFMASLEKSLPPPLVRKFAKAFMKEKPLRNALEQYRRERGGKAPSGELLNRLARFPKFRQLANQFRSQPGSQAALLELARDPQVNALLRGMTGRAAPVAAGKGTAGVASSADGLLAPTPQNPHSAAVVSQRGDPGTLPDPRFAGRGAGISMTNANRSRDAAGGAPVAAAKAAPATGREGSGARASGSAGGAQGEKVRDALETLGPVASVDHRRETASVVDSLFASAPKALRDALLNECEQQWQVDGGCNPVQACVDANRFAECAAVCEEDAACRSLGFFSSDELPVADASSSSGRSIETAQSSGIDTKKAWRNTPRVSGVMNTAERANEYFITQWGPTPYNSGGHPYGYNDCGPTTVVMALAALGLIERPGPEEAAATIDAIRDAALGFDSAESVRMGWQPLATALDAYGAQSELIAGVGIGSVDAAIERGSPVIIGGYPWDVWAAQERANGNYLNSRDPGGHFVAILGKTEGGYYILGDPLIISGTIEITATQLIDFLSSQGFGALAVSRTDNRLGSDGWQASAEIAP